MIYADYNGSAPLSNNVKEYLHKRIESDDFANPNALHFLGRKMKKGLERCRAICAQKLDCESDQLFFTSGSTEAIATIFNSLKEKTYIIVSTQEHKAVIKNAERFEKNGGKVLWLSCGTNGVINLRELEKYLSDYKSEIALVAVIAANNETGVLQPLNQISLLCQKNEVPFFSDTTQLIGKQKCSLRSLQLDFAVVSGHKLGALSGSGILFAKNPFAIRPIILGAGQENGMRGGTENYVGIETMAVAINSIVCDIEQLSLLEKDKIFFEEKLKTEIPSIIIFGESAKRLPTTTYLAIPGIHGQALQIELESSGIFVTTSSACGDNEPAASISAKAMGYSEEIGRGAIRISLGTNGTFENYQTIAEAIKVAYFKLAKIKSY